MASTSTLRPSAQEGPIATKCVLNNTHCAITQPGDPNSLHCAFTRTATVARHASQQFEAPPEGYPQLFCLDCAIWSRSARTVTRSTRVARDTLIGAGGVQSPIVPCPRVFLRHLHRGRRDYTNHVGWSWELLGAPKSRPVAALPGWSTCDAMGDRRRNWHKTRTRRPTCPFAGSPFEGDGATRRARSPDA